jgi:hypothetical protein
LRAIEKGGPAPDNLDRFDGGQRRGVVGFRIAERIGMNRKAVFEDLELLGAMRIEAAGSDANQGT